MLARLTFTIAAVLTLLSLNGCATVFRGSQQPVTFNSEPEGAKVLIDGNLMGRTPTTINLKRNKYKNAMIKKDGYETAMVSISTSYDAISILNILWDSSTTDLLTGNAWEYDPNHYTVSLVKKDASDAEIKGDSKGKK